LSGRLAAATEASTQISSKMRILDEMTTELAATDSGELAKVKALVSDLTKRDDASQAEVLRLQGEAEALRV
jgi:predicted metal-dependent enzyme (double-stranded beta helix superfamily)